LQYCYQYHNDSCRLHADFGRIYSGLDMNLRENLSRVKAGEEERWLAEGDRKYRYL